MEDLRPAKSCLGIRITYTEDDIALDQEAYIESILARAALQCPFNSNKRWNQTNKGNVSVN